jgi:hypothetical protein
MNIQDQFKKNGYEIIGTYKNCHSPCLCVCKYCGKEKSICLHNLNKIKIKCKNCQNLQVANYFEEQGCKLLSAPSKHKKMSYICSCGAEHSILWHHFKNGTRCRNCFSKKMKKESGMKKSVEEKIKQHFEQEGCKLLDDYNGQLQHLNFICSCGRKGKVRWKQFKKGSRCEHCAKERIKNRFIPSGSIHFRWNSDREEVSLNKKIRERIKKALKRVLNETKKEKIKKTFEHLGYTKEDLVKHIKSHSNWNNVKNLDWELDHKFPMKAFFDHGIYDEKIINSLDNLQPLTKMQNRSKNDSYTEEDFLRFIKNTTSTNI